MAEFVGRNNIITGKVKSAARGKVKIEAPSGTFTVATGKAAAPKTGTDATFVISADLVQLSAKRPRGDNVVPCSLISEEFIGSVVTLFLESADGTEYKVQIQERELSKLDERAARQLYISWQTAHAHLLGEGGSQ